MEEMSSPKLFARILAGIVIACLIPVFALTLVDTLIPKIYPDTKFYVGLVGLIGFSIAVVSGYARYQRWLSSRGSDVNRKTATHRGTRERP